jgi:hypothetical protein
MTLADVPATQANSNPAVDPVELADKVDLADIVVEVSSERGGRLPSLSFLSDPSLCAAVHTVRYASRARAQDPLLAPPWARGSTIADVACLRNVRTVIDLRGDRDSSHSLGKYTLVAITACQVLVAHPRGPAWAGSAVARVHKSGQARFVLPFGGGPVANMHVGCGTLLALPPGIVPYAICTTRSRIAPYLYKWFLECTLRRVGIALARGHGARRFVFVNVGGGGSTESKGMLRGQVRAGVVEELPSAPVEIVEALVDKVSFMSLEQYAADIGAEQYGLEMKLML